MSLDTGLISAPADTTDPRLVWDEMVTGHGTIRAHWQPFMSVLSDLTRAGMAERAERARQMFSQDGVTYRARDVPPEESLPWEFDLIPVILQAEEWATLETGLAQRAELFDRLLADLYGPQTLISAGIIPPALVYANPDFLRAVRQFPGPGGVPATRPAHLPFVHTYAADLVRNADGEWQVLADRTGMPAGIGYALENRRVLARALPEGFRASPVRRLKPFFDLWQASLQNLSPRPGDPAQIVMLTRGRRDETFFEHVYLARELGVTLAEPADLTVRDAVLYMKTLDGLARVDVVMRRIEGRDADPLDIGGDPALGVVGLLEAERAGNVVVTNAIGSSLGESPGLVPFLPAASRFLTGDDLAIRSVESHWLGLAQDRDCLLRRLGQYALGPAYSRAPDEGEVWQSLTRHDPAALDELRSRIQAAPGRYVLRAPLPPSTAPVLAADGMEAEPLILRIFLIREGGRYTALPGGLGRVTNRADRVRAIRRQGRMTKDIWVKTAERSEVVIPAGGLGQDLPIRRGTETLPSRIADNLFWLGRYIERVEAGARLLRAALIRLTSGSLGPRDLVEIDCLAASLVRARMIDEQAAGAPAGSAIQAANLAAIAAADGPLQGTMRGLSGPAASLRERFTRDMWQVLNQLIIDRAGALSRSADDIDGLIVALDHVIRDTSALSGMASENMNRGHGWRFLDMGRRIERGTHIAWTVGEALRLMPDHADAALQMCLELSDSTITYRARYLASFQIAPVLDLVLADDTNPRSLSYQLMSLIHQLAAAPDREGIAAGPGLAALMAAIADEIRRLQETRSAAPPVSRLERIASLLEDAEAHLLGLSDVVTRAYFSMVGEDQAFGYDTGTR